MFMYLSLKEFGKRGEKCFWIFGYENIGKSYYWVFESF